MVGFKMLDFMLFEFHQLKRFSFGTGSYISGSLVGSSQVFPESLVSGSGVGNTVLIDEVRGGSRM